MKIPTVNKSEKIHFKQKSHVSWHGHDMDTLENNTLTTSVHITPTNLMQYLHYSSSHLYHSKKAIPSFAAEDNIWILPPLLLKSTTNASRRL